MVCDSRVASVLRQRQDVRMAERDHLGRTPEQIVRERAEIAAALGASGSEVALDRFGRTPTQAARERAEIDAALRHAAHEEDRQARAMSRAYEWASYEEDYWIEAAGKDAEREGFNPYEAREAMRLRLAESRDERVHAAFARFIVDEP